MFVTAVDGTVVEVANTGPAFVTHLTDDAVWDDTALLAPVVDGTEGGATALGGVVLADDAVWDDTAMLVPAVDGTEGGATGGVVFSGTCYWDMYITN